LFGNSAGTFRTRQAPTWIFGGKGLGMITIFDTEMENKPRRAAISHAKRVMRAASKSLFFP
jgi:hypothetical protein